MAPRGWIFGPDAQLPLLRGVAEATGLAPGRAEIGAFADGERSVRLDEEVAGRTVALLVSTSPPVDANVLTLALLADAARRAGARRVVAIVPYFGYARGERMARPGGAIPCRVVADLLEASGVTHLVCLDLHSPAIPGFFTVPLREASALDLLASRFEGADANRTVVVAPDAGGIKRATRVAAALGLPVAVALKERPAPDSPRVIRLLGEVEGREALVVDDMVTTGATLSRVCERLRRQGVRAIDVAAVHPVMAPGAEALLRSLELRRLVVTDAVPFAPVPPWPGLEVVGIAPLLAAALGDVTGELP